MWRRQHGKPDNGRRLAVPDEISNLDLASQARLLDMLPDGTGVTAESHVSMRIISSTTRNLEEEMRGGRFREELYYRINGVNLRLPPLRQRKDDIRGCSIFSSRSTHRCSGAGAPIEFADGGPFVELFLAWKHPRTRKRRTKNHRAGK